MAFTAVSASTTISLIGSSGGNYIGLDNVSVVQTAGGVPEPANWALMILGFGGVGAVLRRRKAMPLTATA